MAASIVFQLYGCVVARRLKQRCGDITTANIEFGRASCGIFATLGKYFEPVTLPGAFSVRMSRTCNTTRLATRHDGGVRMSIDTVLLILILTFAVGYLLNKLDTGRIRSRRPSSPRNGISGRRT